jgi:RNA polymerase sigma factor (sigma-70 family)
MASKDGSGGQITPEGNVKSSFSGGLTHFARKTTILHQEGQHPSYSSPSKDVKHQNAFPRMTAEPRSTTEDTRLAACLARLAVGDASAREELIAIACERMRGIAHRMLRSFPTVRRWDETDDVVQNAAMRLFRAITQITPRDPRGFIGLAAVQIRRELLDLARKHAGPESYAANHETNMQRVDGDYLAKVDEAHAQGEPSDRLDRWTRLHEAAAGLPDDERELFHLVWYLGLNQDEASKLLGCSVRTVKRRWDSAKQLLAAAMPGEPPG